MVTVREEVDSGDMKWQQEVRSNPTPTSAMRSDSDVRRPSGERERHERSEEGAVHGSLGVFCVGCTCGGQKK